jgi:hypothetical protein
MRRHTQHLVVWAGVWRLYTIYRECNVDSQLFFSMGETLPALPIFNSAYNSEAVGEGLSLRQ